MICVNTARGAGGGKGRTIGAKRTNGAIGEGGLLSKRGVGARRTVYAISIFKKHSHLALGGVGASRARSINA